LAEAVDEGKVNLRIGVGLGTLLSVIV